MVHLLGFRTFLLFSGLAFIPLQGGFTANAAAQDFKKPSLISVKNAKSVSPSQGGAKISGRGGYSYTEQDIINTYGDARSRYGAAVSFRDPQMDRQTNGGPFDQGFFFDSAIAPRGGEAPYMN